MLVACTFVLFNLAVAVFSGWLAAQLDFFGTGVNGAQIMAGSVVVTLLLTALAFAWPRWALNCRIALALNAIDLAAVLAVSLWTALTGGGASNPMRFYWMHASVAGFVFALNIGGLLVLASRLDQA